jgi:K+-sensing histidine kinase KdpD
MVSLRRPRIAGGKWIVEGTVSAIGRLTDDLRKFVLDRRHVRSLLIAVELVAAMTLLLLGVTSLIELHHVSSAYLIPVLIAAIRLGMVPALVAACGGVGASAFFFYPPIYDFRVHNPEQLLDLPLFVIVAMVTSQLAARAQANARLAQDREAEMRSLYAFSRRLAVATDAAEIWARADWQAGGHGTAPRSDHSQESPLKKGGPARIGCTGQEPARRRICVWRV